MLDSQHFARTLSGLAGLLPFGKALSEPALLLAWQTYPAEAKQQLSNQQFTYAAGQYLLDPDPPREVPVHLALLRYLYRLEYGAPNFGWGLKPDLPERMARPGEFHPQPIAPADAPPAHHEPRFAPGGVLAMLGQPLPAVPATEGRQ